MLAKATVMVCLVLLAGCRSELFPTTVKADPGVVSDVRSIGKVLKTSQSDAYWDGQTDVTEILVIDVGTPAVSAARTAIDRLRARGWVVVQEKYLGITRMTSSKWEVVELSIAPLPSAKAATLVKVEASPR